MVSIRVPKYISVKFTQTAMCQINSNWLLKTHSFIGKILLCNSGCAESLICFKHTSVFNNWYPPPIILLKAYRVSKEEMWLLGCHLPCRNMPSNMGLLFGHSVMSDSLRPHRLQHARLPCPCLSPGVCSDSCPLSLWCHPIISSSVVPFSFCLQSFPESGSFPMSQHFHQVAKILELQL